ncbi:MAG: MFS transporter [Bacteroidota bacterium]
MDLPTRKTALFAAIYLMEICYGLFLLVASLLAVRVTESPFVLGLTGTLHVATRILGNVGFGRLSDRIGRKRLLLIACVLFMAAYATLRFRSLICIFLAYFVAGVANSIFWPVMEAWIGDGEQREGLMRFLGAFAIVFTVGIASGSLLGGLFMRIAPLASIVIGLFLLTLVAILIFRTKDQPIEGHGTAAAAGLEAADRTKHRMFLSIGWVANFGTWVTIGIMRFLFPKLCVGMGISTVYIGGINTVLYCLWAVTSFLLIRFRRWTYRLGPLIAFQLVGVAAMLIAWFYPSTGTFFAAFGLFGVSAGMTYLSSVFYGQDGAADRGTKSGLHEMILGLGMLFGPFVGGTLAQIFELRTPLLFASAAIVAAIAVEVRLASGTTWTLRMFKLKTRKIATR